MSNTQELANILSEIHTLSYDASSHEATEIIRSALDILKNYCYRNLDLVNIKQTISAVVYKKYKDKNNIFELSNSFAEVFIEKIYKKDWDEKIPTPQELKYWIAQFTFLYKLKSEELIEEMEVRKINNAIKELTTEGMKIDYSSVAKKSDKKKAQG